MHGPCRRRAAQAGALDGRPDPGRTPEREKPTSCGQKQRRDPVLGAACDPADNYDVARFTECGFPAHERKISMQKYLYMGSRLLLRFNVLPYV